MFDTKKEMARAMLDGKVIEFSSGGTARYEEDADDSSEVGLFVYDHYEARSPLLMAWNWYKTASIKQEWYDKVSKEKPRICWVSGLDGDRKTYVARIVKREDGLYVDSVGVRWGYATPVKSEDLGE